MLSAQSPKRRLGRWRLTPGKVTDPDQIEIPKFVSGNRYYLEKSNFEKYSQINTIKTYTEPLPAEDIHPKHAPGPRSNREEVLIVQTDSNSVEVLFLCLGQTTRIAKWHGGRVLDSVVSGGFCVTSSSDCSIRFWRNAVDQGRVDKSRQSQTLLQNHEYLTPSVECQILERGEDPEYLLAGFADGSLRLFFRGKHVLSTSLRFQDNMTRDLTRDFPVDAGHDAVSDLHRSMLGGHRVSALGDELAIDERFSSIKRFIFGNNFIVCKSNRVFLIYLQTDRHKPTDKNSNFSNRRESSVNTSVRHLGLFRHEAPICSLILLSSCRRPRRVTDRPAGDGTRQPGPGAAGGAGPVLQLAADEQGGQGQHDQRNEDQFAGRARGLLHLRHGRRRRVPGELPHQSECAGRP